MPIKNDLYSGHYYISPSLLNVDNPKPTNEIVDVAIFTIKKIMFVLKVSFVFSVSLSGKFNNTLFWLLEIYISLVTFFITR